MTTKKIELTVTAEQARQIEQAQRRGEPVRLQVGGAGTPRLGNPGRKSLPVPQCSAKRTGKGVECVERPDGTREWYRDGKYHREDGPAVEYPDGYRAWYRDGKLHREDGPAVERPDGYREWHRDGKLHREDGPAFEHPDGTRYWHRDGKIHREDGPAVEHPDGTRVWYRDDRLHREDGPAVERPDGYRAWYRDGKFHREDGPAIERADGYRAWYQNDQLHREDGPAIERADGAQEWFLEGTRRYPGDPAFDAHRRRTKNPRSPRNLRNAREALDATSPDYLQRTLDQRNPGPAQAGSVFRRPQTVDSLRNARWTPYPHPNVAPPATAFRAEIPGVLGAVEISVLPLDMPVRFQPAHAGALGDTAEVVAVLPSRRMVVGHTTLIAGPTREDPGAFVMWTVFPGDPTPMQPSISLSPLLHRYPDGRATVADAVREGFLVVKHVKSLRPPRRDNPFRYDRHYSPDPEGRDYGDMTDEGREVMRHPDRSEEWFYYGELHREDGPAVTTELTFDGRGHGKTEYWFRSGKLHRDGGPAVYSVSYEGGPRGGRRTSPLYRAWYSRGKLLREEWFDRALGAWVDLDPDRLVLG